MAAAAAAAEQAASTATHAIANEAMSIMIPRFRITCRTSKSTSTLIPSASASEMSHPAYSDSALSPSMSTTKAPPSMKVAPMMIV